MGKDALKYIISYSGGLGSFMAAKLVADKQGAENCLLLFADTNTEDEDLYRFVDETVEILGIELVRLENGYRDIWDVFTEVKFMGNSRVDPCSKILKRVPLDKYIRENGFTPENCVRVVGVGKSEQHRLNRIQEAFSPYKTLAPLVETPMSQRDIIEVLEDLGIEPPRLYELGFPHNNCGGFCVKTGQRQMALLLKHFPERYRDHEKRQEILFRSIGQHGTIRREIKGVVQYMSMKEFREFLEAGGRPDLYNEPGCGCIA